MSHLSMFAPHHYGYGGGMTDWMAHVAISAVPRADLWSASTIGDDSPAASSQFETHRMMGHGEMTCWPARDSQSKRAGCHSGGSQRAKRCAD
jgi:hypothetical protein